MNDERHAFVTGGSRGIGRAIAWALGQSGLAVSVTYQSREDEARRVVEELAGQGVRAQARRLECGDARSIEEALAKACAEFGDVDVLVNNAAMIHETPFERIRPDEWDRMLAVNLRGPFLCSQRVMPGMLERGFGRIVNVGSIGGQWGGTRQVHYACAKAGLIGLTRSLAKLGAERGVTANIVSPGLIETEMIADELASEEGRAKAAAIPSGRLGTPEEVAAAVAYLVSDDAGYVTGQTLNLNGGMLLL